MYSTPAIETRVLRNRAGDAIVVAWPEMVLVFVDQVPAGEAYFSDDEYTLEDLNDDQRDEFYLERYHKGAEFKATDDGVHVLKAIVLTTFDPA